MAEKQNDKSLNPASISFDEEKFTLLLHIDEEAINFGDVSEIAAQNRFEKKDEFHITVIGFKNGMTIREALDKLPKSEKQMALQQVRSLIARIDWSFTLLPQKYHLTKDYTFRTGAVATTEHRESYIQMVSMPDMMIFYNELNGILGMHLEPPPPHLTLYTRGDNPERAKAGIGINSQEEFLKLNPKPL